MLHDKGNTMEAGYAVAVEADVPMKKKKVSFFKRWFQNQIKSAVAQEREEMNSIKSASLSIGPSRSLDSDKGIRFQVYKANGGFVIETGTYDRRTDRHHNSLHIVTDGEDLGQSIGKIITMEALKQ